jgi:opacity protein-like surface antigen
MKKKTYVVGVAVLLAALLAMAGVAQSAMWVGVELGGNFPASSDVKVNGNSTGSNTNFNPAVIGGATIGYDFVNAGFGAYAWPDWMKYFSLVTDITYNRLDVYASSSQGNGLANALPGGARLEGSALAWTWMLMAHYGFMPDSEIPTGRINPYVGIGPAIVWTTIDAGSVGFGPVPATGVPGGTFQSIGGSTATNIALVAEAGIRWMAFKNVSVDTAYRFRWLEPSWDVGPATVSVPLYMHSFLVRANYHF